MDYKNATVKVFRTTRRAARSVATLFKEEDLDLTQKLSTAWREATKSALDESGRCAPCSEQGRRLVSICHEP
jgi:hypothetical protein